MTTSDIGFAAERLAGEFLANRGYRVLSHNYRKPWGEIDLIAEKDNVLVFVEVKANVAKYKAFAPELRAGHVKMSKVLRTARTFLASHDYRSDKEWQIDVISVTFDKESKTADIKHFKNIEI